MSEVRRRVVTVVLIALLGLSVVAVPTAGSALDAADSGQSVDTLDPALDGAAASVDQPQSAFVQSQIDPDVVVMRADVRESGDADWAVTFRVRLDDENATAAFESVQADVEENATAVAAEFGTGMERTVRSAENATRREMAMENLTVTASTEQYSQEYGVLTYRFTWRNFAGVDDGQLRTGDALSGLFLDSETSLVLAWPNGYEAASVSPEADERGDASATWHGRRAFGPEEPRVVAEPAGESGGLSTPLLVGAGVVLVAVLAGGWVVAGRMREDESAPAAADDAGAGSGVATSAAGGTAAAAGGAAGATGEEGGGDEQDAEADDGPPEELLSNEERVLRLLDDNGGRIKQQRIAGEFDWTDAKTSQVVGNLREEDAVETFRIGRENVVTLPEESDL